MKPSRNGEIKCPSLECNVANMSFYVIRENEILAKISEFTVGVFEKQVASV